MAPLARCNRVAVVASATLLVAVLCTRHVHEQRHALDAWYQQRLEAMGFSAARPTYVEVEALMDSLSLGSTATGPGASGGGAGLGAGLNAGAYQEEARYLVQLAEFDIFHAKSKVPRDDRWVFPRYHRAG